MALVAGDAGCTTGLAKRLFDNWTGDFPANGFSSAIGSMNAGAVAGLKSMCYQFALAIVAEIQANATVLIKNTDGGLQRDADGANPVTLAPAATVTLPGGAVQ